MPYSRLQVIFEILSYSTEQNLQSPSPAGPQQAVPPNKTPIPLVLHLQGSESTQPFSSVLQPSVVLHRHRLGAAHWQPAPATNQGPGLPTGSLARGLGQVSAFVIQDCGTCPCCVTSPAVHSLSLTSSLQKAHKKCRVLNQ